MIDRRAPDVTNIPAELIHAGERWVCWKLEARTAGDKPTKVPYNPHTGTRASSTNPETWADFATAMAAFEEDETYTGIGFCFSPADDVIGYDADDVIDADGNVVNDEARWLLDQLPGAYVEVSPSGQGFKAWARGPRNDRGHKVGSFEAYDKARFFTVTGRSLNGACSRLPFLTAGTVEQIEKRLFKPQARGGNERQGSETAASEARGAEWLAGVLDGSVLHDGLRNLAARYVALGMPFSEVQALLTAAMDASEGKETDPDRWQARVSEIPTLISSAIEKFSAWPEPVDITSAPVHVPHVELTDIVPAPIAQLAASEGRRLGVDPIAIAAHCLAVCSAVLSDDWTIQPKLADTVWRQQARIWVAHVQRTGGRKDDQLRAAMRPVYELEADWRARYQAERERWDEKSDDPEPRLRRLVVSDATIAKLTDLLGDRERHPDCTKLLSVHTELASWFAAMDAYSTGRKLSLDRPHWLQAYDGGARNLDRVMRGSFYVPNWSLAVIGTIQPGVMREAIGKMLDEGLPQRFIIIVPDDPPLDLDADDDIPPEPMALATYSNVVRGLSELAAPRTRSGSLDRVVIVEQAQHHRRELAKFVRLIATFDELPPHLRAAAPKWEGLHARLTLLYHAIELVTTGTTDWNAKLGVGAGPTRMAADFVRRVVYPHAYRFYAETLDTSSKAMENAQWIAGHILARPDLYQSAEPIRRRDIYRSRRTLEKERRQIDEAMAVLIDLGWVRARARDDGWDVSPRVWTTFSEQAMRESARRIEAREEIRRRVRDG